MKLPTLYGRTKTGAIQEWTIETQDDNYRTIYGQVGGKIQISEWTRSVPTNVDRANYRNGVEQAEFEAKVIHKKKSDSGYFEDMKDVDKQKFIEPMLAKKYEDCKDKLKFPVYSQPKLDGCLHGDTLIQTEIGLTPIKNMTVCIKVYTYNTQTNKTELKQVKGVYKNSVDIKERNKVQWYKITTESDSTLILTGNHRVWIDNLKCWRRVDELDGSEEIKLYHQA